KQWQSWISMDDEVASIIHLLTANVSGAVNLTAPQPVTNAEFTKAIGRQLGRPTILPAPRFGLKLALGEFADSLLSSQRVVPEVALGGRYTFRYPDLSQALAELFPR
ncbi:MAG: DUF1731 domain-containing protein, partial [Planctomycetota bacterium]